MSKDQVKKMTIKKLKTEKSDGLSKPKIHKAKNSSSKILIPSKNDKSLGGDKKSSTASFKELKNPNYETVSNVKLLWEKARINRSKKGLSMQEKKTLVTRMIAMLNMSDSHSDKKSLIPVVATKHDMSRVLQTCLQIGRSEDRISIAKACIGHYVTLAESKYGKHFLSTLMDKCPQARTLMCADFAGHVMQLVKHSDAASVLDTLFVKYLTRAEQSKLLSEFYGAEFMLFGTDDAKSGMSSSPLDSMIPAKKAIVVSKLREILDKILLKEKLHHSIVHHLVLDYMNHEQDKTKLTSWVNEIGEVLPELATSRKGAMAALRVLALSSAKERKTIVKAIRKHGSTGKTEELGLGDETLIETTSIQQLAKHQHGHVLLIGIFTLIDDTVMVGTQLIKPLVLNADSEVLNTLVKNTSSRRCLLVLLSGLNELYVPKDILQVLQEAQLLNTGKKDTKKRETELRVLVIERLAKYCMDEWTLVTHNSYQSGLLVDCLCHPKELGELHERLVDKLIENLSDLKKNLEDEENSPGITRSLGILMNIAKKVLRRIPSESVLHSRIHDLGLLSMFPDNQEAQVNAISHIESI